jgi:site-specific recombinase XerD
MKPAAVGGVVKKYVDLAGYDASEFGAHSLRSGFITSARRAGATVESVMRLSGHRDYSTVLGYSQADDAFDNPTNKF